MLAHLLAVLGYVVATFLTQGLSHFVIAKNHYAAVAHLRAKPIVPFGVFSMLIQGAILSYLFAQLSGGQGSLADALVLSWLVGAILVSYIAFGESGKYVVPSISSWIGVECATGFAQFTLFGLLLWAAHRAGA